MAEITLVAEPGRATGSAESRRLRTSGRIPAVVYGRSVASVAVSIDGRDLRHALSGASGINQLLDLQVGDAHHLALARVLQRDPVRGVVTHVDFQVVSRDEVVSAEVPVVLVGEAKAVEAAKGVVEHVLTSLTIHARPGSIPQAITVDIANLIIGDQIRVGQLRLPAGVTTDIDPEETVIVVAGSSTSAEVEGLDAEAAAQAAAEAPAEGAGGDGAAGGPEPEEG